MTDLAPYPLCRFAIALDVFAESRALLDVEPGLSPAEVLSRNWPPRWPHGIRLAMLRDGVVSEDWTGPLRPGESVMVTPRAGIPVPLFLIALTGLSAATLATIGTFLITSAISYGLSKLLAPGAVHLPNRDTSKAYQFTGPETSYLTGGVIPATFGRFPVGGTVLSYVVRNRGLKSELSLLLGLGEGPIAGVGGSRQELDGATSEGLPVGVWLNDAEIGTYAGLRRRIGTIVKRTKARTEVRIGTDTEVFTVTIPGTVNRTPVYGQIGPKVWTRFGTENQRPIPGFNNRERTWTIDRVIGPSTWSNGGADRASVTWKTQVEVDAVELGISCPKGLFQSESDGDLKEREIELRYRFRRDVTGSGFGRWNSFTVRAKTFDAFTIFEYVEVGETGRYVFELDRVTTNAGGNDPDRTNFAAVNEIQFRDFSYPGQALCALQLPASEGLSGSRPRAKVLLDGLLCWIWDGSSETNPTGEYAWTRNPFWIALECMRNTDWGMGGHLRFVRYTLQEWLDAADWADELVAEGPEGLSTTVRVAVSAGADTVQVADTAGWFEDDVAKIDTGGSIETVTVHEVLDGRLRFKTAFAYSHAAGVTVARYEERFRFDGTFDTGRSPWEAVQSILSTCRARVAKSGNRIQLIVARARPTVGLITDGNGVDVKVAYRDWRYQPNHLIGEFLDEDDAWTDATIATNAEGAVLDEASAATYYAREEFRPKTVPMFGLTRRGQVRRELAWQLAVFRSVDKTATARMGLSALVARLGEVLDVAHDVLADVSVSGRTLSALTSGASTLTIDRPVVLAGGTTYAVEVQYRTEQGVTNTVLRQIASSAGTYARGATLTISGTWPASVDSHAPYGLGVLGEVAEPFEIVGYRLDPQSLQIALEMEKYVEALQDAA